MTFKRFKALKNSLVVFLYSSVSKLGLATKIYRPVFKFSIEFKK